MHPDIETLNRNVKLIVGNLSHEDIDVYLFLIDQFQRGSVANNYVFQFVYRSFYRLDSAGLTNEFKERYFELLEDYRDKEDIPVRSITEVLYNIPNRKGQKCLQFSFVTKLINTIDCRFPMYDSAVARIYGFRTPYNYKTYEQRLNEYIEFHDSLTRSYHAILEKNLLKRTLEEFYSKFENRGHIPDIKALDFIMWSAGKLVKSENRLLV